MFTGLEKGVNAVCTLKIDWKHHLLHILSSSGKKQNAANQRIHEFAGNIFWPV